MKSLEIICCLFIVIFALAAAHPLPDNVLEQVEAREDPTAPGLILEDPTVLALVLKDLSEPTSLLKAPTTAALLFEDPTAPALILKDPSKPAPFLKDPTAPADLQKLPTGDNAPSSDVSQEDLQKQKDSEAIMFPKEALEAILNDEARESELQKE